MKNISDDVLICQEDAAILKKYCVGKDVVEIGTYKGGSARIIGKVCNTLVTIDLFPDFRPELKMPITFESVREDLADLGNIFVLKSDGVQAAKKWKDESFDVIFVDDGHKYGLVLDEFHAWKKKLRKNGIFIFHDYIPTFVEKKYPNAEVREAVDYLLFSKEIRVIDQAGSCIVVERI